MQLICREISGVESETTKRSACNQVNCGTNVGYSDRTAPPLSIMSVLMPTNVFE